MSSTLPAKIMSPEEFRLKQQKLALLQQKLRHKENLPHLHLLKLYPWQREFLESRNHFLMLTCANQVGKSTIQHIRMIELSTNQELWKTMWTTRPKVFWLLYPNKDTATQEWENKIKLMMPRNEYKDHPIYGWHEEKQQKKIYAIYWNNGVTWYFKTYAQDVQDLQSGTVHYIGTDEELPSELYPELSMRVNAVDGYMSMVFTPTLGEVLWYNAMERRGTPDETFKGAHKIQTSLYDCQYYEDGTPSQWDNDRIERTIARCPNEAEIQRRVYGRFVFSEGRKYESFEYSRNVCSYNDKPIDTTNWIHYAALDYGSGGSAHPAAILVIAVKPDFTKARIARAWRGDNIRTDAAYIVNKYVEIRDALLKDGRTISMTFYDHSAADLETVAINMGLAICKAEKGHDKGEGIVNGLFQNNVLELDSGDPEQSKLITELMTLRNDTPKRKAKDDLIDALRYASVLVPWKWPEKRKISIESKRAPKSDREWEDIISPAQLRQNEGLYGEINEWNDLY